MSRSCHDCFWCLRLSIEVKKHAIAIEKYSRGRITANDLMKIAEKLSDDDFYCIIRRKVISFDELGLKKKPYCKKFKHYAIAKLKLL